MLNYMRAEGYKLLRRKYLYIFLGTMLALETALALMIVLPDFGNNHVTFANSIGILSTLMIMGIYFGLLMGDMVCSEQYKHNTLKNEVSFGLSRSRIYLGKLAVAVVAAVVLCVLIIGYYIGLCYVIMPHSPADGEALKNIVLRCINTLPLWLGSLGLCHMALMLINNSTMAAFGAIGLLTLLPPAFKLLAHFVHDGFWVAYSLMLTTHFGDTYTLPELTTPMAVTAIGLGWAVVTTAIGLALFRKKEIS